MDGRRVRREVETLAQQQAGVVSRAQLLRAGLTPAQARAPVVSGRWQQLRRGCYLVHTGPVSDSSRVWAALLAAGPGAVAGPATTLWLQGILPRAPFVVDVWVPHDRRVRRAPGLAVRRHRGLTAETHPVALPPQLRLERAVLAFAADAPPEAAVSIVIRAVQTRRTTADRLACLLSQDDAHPRRVLLSGVLSNVEAGVQSMLELRWVEDVERPHRLPAGRLNAPEPEGRTRRYRDLRYDPWGVVCELDGREAHPDAERFRDRRRDNRVTMSGRVTLRYGWQEVVGDPCGVAAEIATVLRSRGWSGRPAACSAGCPAGVTA